MLVVAVFTATVTARPDSAGIVELVKGFAYGTVIVCFTIVQYQVSTFSLIIIAVVVLGR
jgi:hypothetical protein